MWTRRRLLQLFMTITGVGSLWAWWSQSQQKNQKENKMTKTFPLGFQWPVQEPFIFCVHHLDYYPKGNPQFAPAKELLAGRDIGQDFETKDGFRMYHGSTVPGFPVHPHRGFETVTIVRRGYVDHADSMGAAGRYGQGDVQWMTAGSGVQHSEMFPLLHQDQDNTLELFQIWLNLPKRSKMVPAHFKMFWSEQIPKLNLDSDRVSVTVIAGELNGTKALTPPPDSWAAGAENEVMILLVQIKAGGTFELPATRQLANRTIYNFSGTPLTLNHQVISAQMGTNFNSSTPSTIKAQEDSEFLLLQARPIGEPIFQHGPFVMNTREEILQTISDYRQNEFGGWRWPRPDMVHGEKIERFALYPNGKKESPPSATT